MNNEKPCIVRHEFDMSPRVGREGNIIFVYCREKKKSPRRTNFSSSCKAHSKCKNELVVCVVTLILTREEMLDWIMLPNKKNRNSKSSTYIFVSLHRAPLLHSDDNESYRHVDDVLCELN